MNNIELDIYLDLQKKEYVSSLELLCHVAEYIFVNFGVRCGSDYMFYMYTKTKKRKSAYNKLKKHYALNKFLDSINNDVFHTEKCDYLFNVLKFSESFYIDIARIELEGSA